MDAIENKVADEQGALTPALMTDPKVILAFMFAGDATLTFRGEARRYTYLIQEGNLSEADKTAGRKPLYFVKVLTGSDNESDYTYMGMIKFGNQGRAPQFTLTAASFRAHMTEATPCVAAFKWVFDRLLANHLPSNVEIWHEGRCARCGRKLTDNISIERGFGPTCFELAGGMVGIQNFYVSLAPIANLQPQQRVTLYAAVPQKTAEVVVRPTPAQIVAEVDAMMAQKVTVAPVKAEPKKEVKVVTAEEIEALAQSQGWSVAEAEKALDARRIISTVNSGKKKPVAVLKRPTVAVDSDEPLENDWEFTKVGNDPAIVSLVDIFKASDPKGYTMDGIMNEDEAFSFWYRRFESNPTMPEV